LGTTALARAMPMETAVNAIASETDNAVTVDQFRERVTAALASPTSLARMRKSDAIGAREGHGPDLGANQHACKYRSRYRRLFDHTWAALLMNGGNFVATMNG
jgi:hypothetical protein